MGIPIDVGDARSLAVGSAGSRSPDGARDLDQNRPVANRRGGRRRGGDPPPHPPACSAAASAEIPGVLAGRPACVHCSRRFASSVAKELNWLRNSSFCCCELTNALTLAGVSSHSVSGIPAESSLITGGSLAEIQPEIRLPSRVNQGRQLRELSCTLNGYKRDAMQLC